MNQKIILKIIKDCFVIGCFTILAVKFNHWWIVLFSWLFVALYLEEEKK